MRDLLLVRDAFKPTSARKAGLLDQCPMAGRADREGRHAEGRPPVQYSGSARPRAARFRRSWFGPSCKVGRARKERNGSKKTGDVPRRSPPQGRSAQGQAGSQAGAQGGAPRERGERTRDRGGRGGGPRLAGGPLVLAQQGR